MDHIVLPDPAPAIPTRLRKSRLDFPVVGLGASAGGVQALQRFFSAMPARNGMAFAVVMHLSPRHQSYVAEVLQQKTTMPVIQVTETVDVEPDHVYVIPPCCDLFMDDGLLRLSVPTRVGGSHVSVDIFFRTLAEVHGEHSVGVVLSGTGADGSEGIRRIRAVGGMTLAQSPDDCVFDGMPKAAIASNTIDFVLPAAEMPQRLLELLHEPADNPEKPVATAPEPTPELPPDSDDLQEQALKDILQQLKKGSSHDFRHYKRATVMRRITRRLELHGLPDLAAYAEYLRTHAEENALLLQDMLISVTNFFRDKNAFDSLGRTAVPDTMENRPADAPVRAWVAGCATGEEAYSFAMMLHEAAEKWQPGNPSVLVFASDIDERALSIARRGTYSKNIEADIPSHYLNKYFLRQPEGFQVSASLRASLLFAAHNVLRDPPFSKLDIICCRNLLIYLKRAAQINLLEIFHFALNPGGYLFLGSSESADMVPELFTVVDKKHRIYRNNPQPPIHAPPRRSGATLFPTNHAAISPTPASTDPDRTRNGMAEVHAKALESVVAQSVLIDTNSGILHLSVGAGRYMEPPGGVLTNDLLSNVHPALRIDLRSALFLLSQTGKPAYTPPVHMGQAEGFGPVRMSVHPVSRNMQTPGLTLVLFEEIEEADTSLPSGHADDRILVAGYEKEAERMKAHLRHIVEQAEISTDDLTASNEELQSINEELHSLTEELETSKEELQSMNEELSTVNSELKSKVDETDKVNDDLQNFILASEIACLFVGRDLHLKRFTPQAASIFNIIVSDINRSLLDISNQLEYPELAEDLRDVIEKLKVVERPVNGKRGQHYLARLRPYRTTDNKITGAMLTFVDVTELRAARLAVRDQDGPALQET
jgi:two-component system CheB/CheR fusion protein